MAQLDGANYFMCDLEFKKVGLFVLVLQVFLFVTELKKNDKYVPTPLSSGVVGMFIDKTLN